MCSNSQPEVIYIQNFQKGSNFICMLTISEIIWQIKLHVFYEQPGQNLRKKNYKKNYTKKKLPYENNKFCWKQPTLITNGKKNVPWGLTLEMEDLNKKHNSERSSHGKNGKT